MNKREILQALNRTVLLEISRVFEVSGLTPKKREDIIEALMRIRSIPAEDILNALRIDDLKDLCRKNGISPKSWRKNDIIKALSADDSPVPPKKKSRPSKPKIKMFK